MSSRCHSTCYAGEAREQGADATSDRRYLGLGRVDYRVVDDVELCLSIAWHTHEKGRGHRRHAAHLWEGEEEGEEEGVVRRGWRGRGGEEGMTRKGW